MSALVERITAVLREHELESHLNTGWICACGWKDGTKTYPTHPAHVAERIAALFTEETQFVPVARDGSRWAARSREEAYSIPNEPAFNVSDSWIVDHIEAERRWVSEWAAEETP